MNYALLLSGGTGSRTESEIPKQYVKAGRHMMVTYALKVFFDCNDTDSVYIVSDPEWRKLILDDISLAGLDVSKIKGFAEPGENRQCSILNGMKEMLKDIDRNGDIADINDEDTVFIHDAARPFLTAELLKRCYEALPGHDGVMPVLSMKDTVYRSEDGSSITELLTRSEVFAGQAPELFRLKSYYEANLDLLPERILKINGASEVAFTAGMDIVMIPGDERNTKVTTKEDLMKFIQTVEKHA